MKPATLIGILAAFVLCTAHANSEPENPYPKTPPSPAEQTNEDVARKSKGCMSCHTATESPTMHANEAVRLGCIDCHGGDAQVFVGNAGAKTSKEYVNARDRAHVLPKFPKDWNYPSSANPERSYTLLNKESPDYVRFVNPSDYRVAKEACGACHQSTINKAHRSLMATTAMFWGGASYNNGILPFKNYIMGEAYTFDGKPAAIEGPVLEDPAAALRDHGVIPSLVPMPTWETMKPGDVFRVFERGGRTINNQFAETGLPNVLGRIQQLVEPGRPDIFQSNRGPGTGARISVPVLNLQKTRLNDPLMWFLGTNDHPGDFRSSGCASCHVVYANDRDPMHSGPYARFGHLGLSQTADPTIDKTKSGHPLGHRFTRASHEPVHRLPHAPAEHVHEHVHGLHDVGLRVRRVFHVASGAALPDCSADSRDQRAQSGSCSGARFVG
jgi:hypothetical protein